MNSTSGLNTTELAAALHDGAAGLPDLDLVYADFAASPYPAVVNRYKEDCFASAAASGPEGRNDQVRFYFCNAVVLLVSISVCVIWWARVSP
jgi:hypothetical protein